MDFKFGIFWIFISAIFLIPIDCVPEDATHTPEVTENSKEIEPEVAPDIKEPENIALNQSGESVENIKNEEEITPGEIQSILRESANIENYEEADDMEYGGSFQNRTIFIDAEPINEPVDEPEEQPAKEVNEGGMVISDPIQSNLKYAVEWIESADENTVDIDDIHSKPLHLIETTPWSITIAAIGAMFILFLFGTVFMYRLFTKRYNNREILINEEDMIDPNDMKHFSL